MGPESPPCVLLEDDQSVIFHEDGTKAQSSQPNASINAPDEPQDDSTHYVEQNSRLNSLYHQIQPSPATPLARSESHDAEPSSSTSRKTPIRAVFHDLPTAYLSITSGSARSRSQDASDSFPEAYIEEESIPLQDLIPPSRLPDDLLQILPLPQVPALASKFRINDTREESLPGEHDEPIPMQHIYRDSPQQPEVQDQTAASPTAIDEAPALPSSSGIRDEVSDAILLSQWPQQSNILDTRGQSPESVSRKMLDTAINNDTASFLCQYSSHQSKSRSGPSAPEDSTVGNIYQHYAGSTTCDGDSDSDRQRQNIGSRCHSYHLASINSLSPSSISEDWAQPSALKIRKQRRIDRSITNPYRQPPLYGLPAVPTYAPNHATSSTLQDFGQSSSYGDTKNLLEITQQSDCGHQKPVLSRSEGRNDLRLEQAAPELGGTSEPSVPSLNSNRAFQLCYPSPVLVSQPNEDDCLYGNGPNFDCVPDDRQPLEREVSKALRRASGFSTFSTESLSSSLFRHEDFERDVPAAKRTALSKRVNFKDTPPLASESLSKDTRKAVGQGQEFYDKSAIPRSWITAHEQNAVRIPINRNGLLPSSPPKSPLEAKYLRLGPREYRPTIDPEEDANDWETVGESKLGADSRDAVGMCEVSTIHRTGSSLANTSNDGTASNPEIDDYGSTDRITEYPGTIQCSGDYRQQDLKQTRIPVFPPVYREHKVNGYLAELTRYSPPSNPFNHIPHPLASPHTNPFISPPPEVLSSPAARRGLIQKRSHRFRGPNHFPPSTKSITTYDAEMSQQDMESISSAVTPTISAERERTYRRLNWMEEFSDPGPTLNHKKRQFLSPINPVGRPDRPSSWRHLMVFGRGDTIQGYNADGTVADTESNNLDDIESMGLKLQDETQPDNFIEPRRYPEPRRLTCSREYKPLVRGPPGAFYQGIARLQQDFESAGPSHTPARFTKIPPRYSSPKEYPTNALRPLSLLANRPGTPTDTRTSNFTYRSPLAPPRRLSWQQLYTEAQLNTMQEAAKADGLFDVTLEHNAGNLSQDVRERSAHRNLTESPRLYPWYRTSSVPVNISYKKRTYSIIALLLCTLFPPLLLLYALGRLDKLIVWWSNGEFSAFGKCQKRWAYILLSVWGFVIFLVLIILLVFRFTPSN
jgi:hypothetical protein